MRTSTVQCNLTALCLQYLTFECFEQDTASESLSNFANAGYFVFQDYAIANWSHHVYTVVESGQKLLAPDVEAPISFEELRDAQNAIEELENALNDFVNRYEDDLLQENIVESSEAACEAFDQCNFYYSLQLIWSHVNRHQKKGFEARNDVSLKGLSEALIRNRKLLEDLTLPTSCSSGRSNNLDSFYGDKPFKCPKLTCFYFHEGFKDGKARDIHVNRHNRPFQCTVPDCSTTEFGFRSSKELEKHVKHFHPETLDPAVTFVATRVASGQAQWECTQPGCDKRFTRNFHLRNHLRTHNDERPFRCSECDKAFTRANDCKRHEKIHARR